MSVSRRRRTFLSGGRRPLRGCVAVNLLQLPTPAHNAAEKESNMNKSEEDGRRCDPGWPDARGGAGLAHAAPPESQSRRRRQAGTSRSASTGQEDRRQGRTFCWPAPPPLPPRCARLQDPRALRRSLTREPGRVRPGMQHHRHRRIELLHLLAEHRLTDRVTLPTPRARTATPRPCRRASLTTPGPNGPLGVLDLTTRTEPGVGGVCGWSVSMSVRSRRPDNPVGCAGNATPVRGLSAWVDCSGPTGSEASNQELTAELALHWGRLRCRLVPPWPGRRFAVIGRDPRASGEMLEAAVIAGVTSEAWTRCGSGAAHPAVAHHGRLRADFG